MQRCGYYVWTPEGEYWVSPDDPGWEPDPEDVRREGRASLRAALVALVISLVFGLALVVFAVSTSAPR